MFCLPTVFEVREVGIPWLILVKESLDREGVEEKLYLRVCSEQDPGRMDLLPPPNKETVEKIRNLAGVDEQRIKEAVKILSKWLQLQPHLPHQYDEVRMETLFLRCKTSIERSKENIDMYYTVKAAIPEIFTNRDPLQPWFTVASSVRCFIPLPQLTEDYDRISLVACLDPDPEKYIVYDILKMVTMVIEIRTLEDYYMSDILLVDFNNLTMGHVLKYTLPVLKKLEVMAVKAYKARVKGIHFINAPTFVDTTVQLFKSLLATKLANRIHIHRKGSNTLFDFVSPKILPKEYGGNAASIHELWGGWKKKLESYRSWFLEQDEMMVDEPKRPGKSFNSSELFGFEGTFRQLTVD